MRRVALVQRRPALPPVFPDGPFWRAIKSFLMWAGQSLEEVERASTSREEYSVYRVSGQATYDPASLDDGEGVTTTVAVSGAVLGDFAVASFSLDLQGILLTAYVSDTDEVSVRFQNETGGTINLDEGTLKAWALKTP